MSNTTKPWIEEYRPNSLDNILTNKDVVNSLKSYLRNYNIPHLVFFGMPGTGKTTTIRCIGKELYGKQYKNMVMEINASEERGIDMIRNKVKPFVSVFPHCESKIPFKLIILDEADAITDDAQSMLRRVIEKHSSRARFCLICNKINKITPAITSRCSRYKFSPISIKYMITFSINICKERNVKYNRKAIELICKNAKGDMRKVINGLQTVVCQNNNVDLENISKILGFMIDQEISEIIKILREKEAIYEIYKKLWNIVKTKSYSVEYLMNSILKQLEKEVKEGKTTEDEIINFIDVGQKIEEFLYCSSNEEQALIGLATVLI